ncbi:hypothetical protein cypCar_00033087 [Cyprinus carpio]|nr:hypothetical protein cypCar_00033087 [Cyprinus carpio]
MMGKANFYEDRNFQVASYELYGRLFGDFSSYMSRCHSCRVGGVDAWDDVRSSQLMGNQYFFRRENMLDYMSMFGNEPTASGLRIDPYAQGILQNEDLREGELHGSDV